MFSMSQAMNVVLMVTGVFTIIAAVMMALVQHNMKRLMGYHAISQVGYMILGIGTGTPVGIAGGLFHMLNNAIYKSCLFFTAGNVEYRVKTTELNELGGLSKLMPFTYISCLIASLSIAGIPPFNGFISKWMIYQGLIGNLQQATQRWQMALYMACLAAAMFGSALTLASFVKLLHAVFLGQKTNKGVAEVPWMMWLPCVLLAASCVIFGLFAGQIPFKYFIYPLFGRLNFLGSWNATVAVILVIVSLALGFFLFKMKLFKPKSVRIRCLWVAKVLILIKAGCPAQSSTTP
jgi:multicomponent Na+:H+ antiporter subunit A